MIVEPVNNNITNCFIPLCIENVLSEYLNYKGYEYQYTFAYALNFKFNINNCFEGRVADGLNIEFDFIGLLDDIYNISIKKIEFDSGEKIFEYVNNSIRQEEPVIIHLDSYYLPWSTLYHKEHTRHIVLAIDVNAEKGIIKVADTIEKEYYYDIGKDIIEKACKFVWKIYLPDKPVFINPQQFDILVEEEKICLISEERIRLLKSFVEVFEGVFNPDIEFRNKYDLELMRTEKLVDDIRKIILQINLFCNWMIWRDNHADKVKFKCIVEVYLQVMSKWNVFINLLYKNCIIGWKKPFRNRGVNILTQIVNLEKCAYLELKKSINIKGYEKSGVKLLEEVEKYYIVLLEDKYNNKGFCYDLRNRINEDLTGVGEFFVIKETVVSNFDSMSYNFDNQYDNVVCEGQEIIINCEYETFGLYFLACSEWGSVDESLIIVDNKRYQNITLHIQDLSQIDEGMPYFLGKTYNINGDIVQENAAVYIYKVFYDKTYVNKIILPDCPNLHILKMILIG